MQRRSRSIVDHVGAWRRSGLSVVAYCRQAGISENTYYYWRKRLLLRGAVVARPSSGPSPLPFLEIGARPAGPSGYALRFDRVGVDLLVGRGFDAVEVRTLARLACSLEEGGGAC